MAFTIEKQFTVDAGVDAVWEFLTDPHRVAACLPGASITEQKDENTYTGKMNVKVGPVASSYKGTITFERLDRETWTAELAGRGQDVKGRGGASMKMTSQLVDNGGSTEVTVSSDVTVTGVLAQFGRGMIQDVSDQLFQVFTERMRAELKPGASDTPPASEAAGAETSVARPSAPHPTEEALDVGSLGAAAASRAVGRMLRRPTFWIGVVIGVVLIYLLVVR